MDHKYVDLIVSRNSNQESAIEINPRHYGDLPWLEYVSERFSVFNIDEAQVFVAYFVCKLEEALHDVELDHLKQALGNF